MHREHHVKSVLECRAHNETTFLGKVMTDKKYSSLRVPADRKMALEKAAIEISYATGKPHKWTEVAVYVIDEYLKEAIRDLKAGKKK